MDDSERKKITAPLKEASIDWQKVLSNLIACFGCSTGTLYFLDADSSVLKLNAQVGISAFLLRKVFEIPIGKGMAGIAAERREPVEMCNLQSDTSGVARPAAKETKVEGSIAVPMMRDGILYGTLGIAKPVSYQFTEAERNELMTIGEEIAEFLT